jgi:deazaflavin-dependent oxidoreductase (nitroreductase family)
MAIEVPPRGTRGGKGMPSGPLARAMTAIARFIHRRTGNKMSGVPLAYLSTIGAKSGQRRTVPVMVFPDGEDAWFVVASRGGTADHPGWYYNLAKHPDQVEIERDGRKIAVTPRRLTGDEKTDREIPVVRLATRTDSPVS